MKFTKKQRREIYLEVAEHVIEHEKCICWSFHSVIYGKNISAVYGISITDFYKEVFPEFAEFQPTELENDGSGYWYYCDYKTRSIALLLMAEMCKEEKL
jgi:hypothetical protein